MDLGSIGTIWTICYFLVLIGFSLFGIHRFVTVYLFLKHRRDIVAPLARFEKLPVITVQLPMFNERYVARRLLQSVCELDYPRELLEIQVLDDSTDDTIEVVDAEVAALRQRGFDIQIIRRLERTGYKAGALAEGMKTCRGEFVFILDADFVANPDVLQRTIHFFTDPKIGMVQTRWEHLNRNYSLLTRIQALFLDGHLLLEQTSRFRSGRFFGFNGTAGIWRKSCIEAAGGWQADTLTEDLDLSYRAQLLDWQFVYLPDVTTPAELPVDMNGFKSQQHRWTKGSIQTCLKILPAVLRSKFSWRIKLEACIHLTSNFTYLLLACLCVLMQPHAGASMTGWVRVFLIDLPIFIAASFSVLVFHLCAQTHLRPRSWLREILYLPCLLAVGIGLSINNSKAVLEAIFHHETPFNRTPKYGIEQRNQDWRGAVYAPLKSMMPLVELGFAGYFTFVLIREVAAGHWLALPFIFMFQAGFAYVAISSILQNLNIRWGNQPDVPESNEAVPA